MTAVEIPEFTGGLIQDDDGIWHTGAQSEVSYPESGHSGCFAVENDSFWFNHRNAAIRALVALCPPPPDRVVLDVGGGNGFVSRGLQDDGLPVVLVEPGPVGARNARARGVDNVICATTQSAAVAPRSAGAIGLFDVVEHIEDDRRFIRDMTELLAPGGVVYATVPAHRLLWSKEDIVAGHFRRYGRSALLELFEHADLDVVYCGYFFRPLPLPIFLFRALPFSLRRKSATLQTTGTETALSETGADAVSARRSQQHGTKNGLLVRTARRLLRREVANVKSGRQMRFGASLLIAARTRSDIVDDDSSIDESTSKPVQQ